MYTIDGVDDNTIGVPVVACTDDSQRREVVDHAPGSGDVAVGGHNRYGGVYQEDHQAVITDGRCATGGSTEGEQIA